MEIFSFRVYKNKSSIIVVLCERNLQIKTISLDNIIFVGMTRTGIVSTLLNW